jgi:type IV secretory pathway TrbL component
MEQGAAAFAGATIETGVQITVLMVSWLLVLIAFFILAVQLFVTLIEFKLTTLAGFNLTIQCGRSSLAL